MDHETKKVVAVYKSIMQPIAKRRPPKPSFVYNAHILAEKWNALCDKDARPLAG